MIHLAKRNLEKKDNMSIWKFFTFLFAIIALLFEGFFGIIQLVSFVLQIILISFFIYFIIWIFRRKSIGVWYKKVLGYCIVVLAFFGFLNSLFLAFIEYQYYSPGVVSDITLSNFWQEIVFIQMSHIATPEFFQEKKATLASLAQNGYIILVEWVKPGTDENQIIFNQSVGFNFTPTLYSEVAQFIWLQSQDNKILFEWISTGSLVNVDLSIDDIISFMGTWSQVNSWIVFDIESEIRSLNDVITPRERIFAGWIAWGLLNWSLKQSGDPDLLTNVHTHPNLFTTIINHRNDRIIEYIQKNPNKKIAIVYWALHFNGVYESLQKIDPNWKTVNTRISKPYNK